MGNSSVYHALCFLMLAVQFGLQPTLNKFCIPPGSSKVLLIALTELLKIFFALLALLLVEPLPRIVSLLSDPVASFKRAFLPAALYSLQNFLILSSLPYISPLSMSLLNQTKTLSAAFCSWVLLNKKQSPLQIVALLGLILGASLIVVAENKEEAGGKQSSLIGIVLVLLASLISGLSSTATEIVFRDSKERGPTQSYLFSLELSVFSLCVLTSTTVVWSEDVNWMETRFSNKLLIPLFTNALGGILVGIVTQYFGGVKKGFALILGICLAACVEANLGLKEFSMLHLGAVFCVCLSMWVYFTFPPSSSSLGKEKGE